ncbi:alpha/beta hydrolase [Agrococcus casei]|uniref:alpha/beta hydrolase n=1 Tax=Agrococcus casei TaxID=343512 RepID=UPI003F936927
MQSRARRAARGGLTALAGAVSLAAVGTTVLSAVLAHLLVTPPKRKRDDVKILSLDEKTVTLNRTLDTELPGRYALWVGDRLVRIGEIVDSTASTVTRRLSSRARLRIMGRKTARFSGYFLYRPRDLDYPFEHAVVETELGPAPAWIFGTQNNDTWCIQVHGRGVTRRETVRAVQPYADAGMPVMCISYRNDGEAPRSGDGRYRLGLDEWRDVDSAIEFALARGAKRVVVMGWSMGGAISLQLVRRSRFRRHIIGLALDSPVVGWEPTLREQTNAAGLPAALVHTATRMLESPVAQLAGGQKLSFSDLDSVRHAGAYSLPILLLHSADDGFVPPDASREFATARPDIVRYHEWTGARHTKLWNWDEERYREQLSSWIADNGFGTSG